MSVLAAAVLLFRLKPTCEKAQTPLSKSRSINIHRDSREARRTGTMEVQRFPGEWPMTEEAIAVLRSLDALGQVP